ncbi:hypothetical protein FMUND_13609 [Fusarium mundagurra]|uniref:Uncharacterized protein n=1 Tax=Fusarium mundagurra TaxID=1567541 RepID=A0A8H5XY50_9HYPO|nr:hypothetical protein FMUND_13609 [Fusarium mundagurra]
MSSQPTTTRKASEERPQDETTRLRTVPQIPPTSLSDPEPEPMEEVPVPEPGTVPETSDKQALPAVGPAPDPTLPVVDSTQNKDDIETSKVPSIPGANAQT